MDKKPLIGLGGVIVATMSAELNSQLSSIGLADITAGLGLSHDQGTWFTSLYASAVVLGMVLAPWCAVTFTLRRFTLFVIGLTFSSTILVPFAPNVEILYGLRIIQGMSQGLTIPLLMTTALRVLAPDIRLFGLAAYALTATFFPNLSTSVAALWVDVLEWHFIFFQVVPLSALAALLVWFGLPQDPPKYERLRLFDWRGFLLVLFGLGSLTTMLLQGDRLDWFHSKLICVLALISLICVPLLLVNEWFEELPLLKLQFLERRNFAYGVIGLFLFIVIIPSSTEIPLAFLEAVQGYRPLQGNLITLEIAASQLLLLPLMAVVLDRKWLDSRYVSFFGLSCILIGCLGASRLDVSWNREQFYLWQACQSVGESCVVLPLLMMATNTVKGPHEGPFASALVNSPRAVAEVVGVWLVQTVLRVRGSLHSARLVDRLGMDRFRFAGQASAVPSLGDRVQVQALVLTLSDAYIVIAGVVALLMLVLLFLPVRTYPPRVLAAGH
jgi:MFS transporter, DHA2 family, multidrug resistance protein